MSTRWPTEATQGSFPHQAPGRYVEYNPPKYVAWVKRIDILQKTLDGYGNVMEGKGPESDPPKLDLFKQLRVGYICDDAYTQTDEASLPDIKATSVVVRQIEKELLSIRLEFHTIMTARTGQILQYVHDSAIATYRKLHDTNHDIQKEYRDRLTELRLSCKREMREAFMRTLGANKLASERAKERNDLIEGVTILVQDAMAMHMRAMGSEQSKKFEITLREIMKVRRRQIEGDHFRIEMRALRAITEGVKAMEKLYKELVDIQYTKLTQIQDLKDQLNDLLENPVVKEVPIVDHETEVALCDSRTENYYLQMQWEGCKTELQQMREESSRYQQLLFEARRDAEDARCLLGIANENMKRMQKIEMERELEMQSQQMQKKGYRRRSSDLDSVEDEKKKRGRREGRRVSSMVSWDTEEADDEDVTDEWSFPRTDTLSKSRHEGIPKALKKDPSKIRARSKVAVTGEVSGEVAEDDRVAIGPGGARSAVALRSRPGADSGADAGEVTSVWSRKTNITGDQRSVDDLSGSAGAISIAELIAKLRSPDPEADSALLARRSTFPLAIEEVRDRAARENMEKVAWMAQKVPSAGRLADRATGLEDPQVWKLQKQLCQGDSFALSEGRYDIREDIIPDIQDVFQPYTEPDETERIIDYVKLAELSGVSPREMEMWVNDHSVQAARAWQSRYRTLRQNHQAHRDEAFLRVKYAGAAVAIHHLAPAYMKDEKTPVGVVPVSFLPDKTNKKKEKRKKKK